MLRTSLAVALFTVSLPSLPASAAEGDIHNFVGAGRASGDGGPALAATFNHPQLMTGCSDGTLFVEEFRGEKIRKIDRSGNVTTLASPASTAGMSCLGGYLYALDMYAGDVRWNIGTGAPEPTDGCVSATSAMTASDGTHLYDLYWPAGPSPGRIVRHDDPVHCGVTGLAAIPNWSWQSLRYHDGKLYAFSQQGILVLNLADLTTSTLPGIPFGQWPYRVSNAFDGTYLYIVESFPYPYAPENPADNVHQVRRVRISDGYTDVFAGGGQGDRDGVGTAAAFSFPFEIWYSSATGKLYVADMFNQKIKSIDPQTAMVTTIAGAGQPWLGRDKALAELNSPLNLTADKDGTLYIADTGSQRVLKVDTAGIVTSLAGSGLAGDQDGTGDQARFRYPCHVGIDGEFAYVADFGTHKIRRIHKQSGEVTTLSGTGIGGYRDGKLSEAQFRFPWGLVVQNGRIYVADTGNQAIREIDLAQFKVRTLAGSPGVAGTADGVGPAARFNGPRGLEADGGFLYIADSDNHAIRKLNLETLEVTTVAGIPGSPGYVNDSNPHMVRFVQPWGISSDPSSIYVADTGNNRLRKVVKATGATSLLTGSGAYGDSEGAAATAMLGLPQGLFSEHWLGRLLVADTFNHKIKSVEIPTSALPEPPQPPSDLAAVAQEGLKVRVTWQPSGSAGVTEYRVYMAQAGAGFDFFHPLVVVSSAAMETTAEGLTDGQLYRFIVRAAAGALEEKNTTEVSATAFNALVCPGALIKNPDSGKKVSGRMLTVMAGFPDEAKDSDVARVRRVLFQYRPLLQESFLNIPAANVNHPNPDETSPYFTHWDVSGLPNGEYFIRALSDCGSGYPADAPYITISVEKSKPSQTESVSNGDQVVVETVADHKDNTVIVADATSDQTLQVDIPAGTLSSSTDTVSVKFKQKGQGAAAYDAPTVFSQVDISLGSGQSRLAKPVELTFAYDPRFLSSNGTPPDRLVVGYLDGSRWIPLPTTVNASRGEVRAQTTHFSTFGLLAAAQVRGGIALGDVYFYPNPAVKTNPILHAETNASAVILRIYNKAGEKVHEATIQGPPQLVNDGDGLEPAFEYTWDVSRAASDVYFYYVEARNSGYSDVKKVGKVAVIK